MTNLRIREFAELGPGGPPKIDKWVPLADYERLRGELDAMNLNLNATVVQNELLRADIESLKRYCGPYAAGWKNVSGLTAEVSGQPTINAGSIPARRLSDEPTRKQALDDLVRLSEEVGGYDLPVQSSEPTRDLTSSEAASFERTRARSPRRIQAQCARCGGIGEHQPWCHTYP